MRSGSFWGPGLALLLASSTATAADLTLSGSGVAEYDSNALRRGGDEDDDFLFRFRPAARIHEDRGQDFRYFVEYALPFEFAAENDELDDIDHYAAGRLAYHPNDRLEIFASDTFRYLRGAQFDIAEYGDDGLIRINEERERVTLNNAEVGAAYQFTPRLGGSARASHEFFDSDRDDRAENWLVSGIGDLSYVLTPRHSLIGGFQLNHQQFGETENIVASQVTAYHVFLGWTWQVDETLTFQVRAGPTYLDTQQDDPATSVTVLQPVVFAEITDPSFDERGFVDSSGTPILIDNPADLTGGLIVARPAGCRTVDGNRVAPCNFVADGTPDASVVLDPVADAALIGQIQALGPVMPINNEPTGSDDTSVDVFAAAVLTKSWTPNFHTGLRYTRRQGGASGLGGAVIEDLVSLSNNWDFADRWNLFVRADWSYRETVTEATSTYLVIDPSPLGAVDLAQVRDGAGGLITVRGNAGQIETMRYGAATRVTHRFTRNTSFWGQLTYNRQESQGGTLGDPSDFDDFLASVGVRHVFDPIKLW